MHERIDERLQLALLDILMLGVDVARLGEDNAPEVHRVYKLPVVHMLERLLLKVLVMCDGLGLLI